MALGGLAEGEAMSTNLGFFFLLVETTVVVAAPVVDNAEAVCAASNDASRVASTMAEGTGEGAEGDDDDEMMLLLLSSLASGAIVAAVGADLESKLKGS
jgi:hypothetical protein